jgi:glutamate synthase domain-containing protein 3
MSSPGSLVPGQRAVIRAVLLGQPGGEVYLQGKLVERFAQQNAVLVSPVSGVMRDNCCGIVGGYGVGADDPEAASGGGVASAS